MVKMVDLKYAVKCRAVAAVLISEVLCSNNDEVKEDWTLD